ncbi:MAG TPA: FAD-binding oxidoreductase [Anaerolineae bacterium]|nr:FAD-binding oxidoreductase [Anaerolineae bacterium]
MKPQHAEVVVVGAGSTGLSTTYELARAGVDVLLVDRRNVAMEAGGRNPGGIRQIGRDPDEVPLMVAAMRRWHGLAEELGCDLELAEDGYLWVALTEQDLEMQRGLAVRDAAYGIREYALVRDQVRDMAPAISDRIWGGLYSPTDLIANPFLVARGYLAAARRCGARVLLGTEVLDLDVREGRIHGLETSAGRIETRTVINAAGPWSDRIASMAGVDIPITPCPNQFILTEPMPPILPPFLLISGIAVCRQSARGHVYIGNTNAPGGITGLSKATNYEEMTRTVTNILKIVPAFRGLNIIRTWVGTIDFSPDDNFIFGRVDEVEGLILASGFSGHGFALTPIIGQLLCELVVQGETSLPVEAFRLDRFKRGVAEKAGHFAHQHLALDTTPGG